MDWRLALQHSLVGIDERSRSGKERLVTHPTRGSVICVSNAALLELDAATGATTAEISFDLPLASAAATTDISPCSLDLVMPVGIDHVVSVCQSSNLAIWNLREESLEGIVDLERGLSSKSITALATSLCRDKWLFYCVEGSANIKVLSLTTVLASPISGDGKDHGLPSKKISRKTTNRNSQLTALAYQTAMRLLVCGSSDGTFQLWMHANASTEDDGSGPSGTKDDVAPASLLFTSTATATTGSPVVHLAFASSSGVPASSTTPSSHHYFVVAYQNRVVEVWAYGPLIAGRKPRDPQRLASVQLPPQPSDFAKKNGELCAAMHPQLPLLIFAWNSSAGASSPCVAVWEFGRGSSSDRGIKWRDAKTIVSAGHPLRASTVSDSDPGSAAAIFWANQSLRMCTSDSSMLSLDACILQPVPSSSNESAPVQGTCTPVRGAYSTALTLSLEQFHSYKDTPTALLQVSTQWTPSSRAGGLILQRFSLLTGTSGVENKLESLPDWKNYLGAQLVPWQILASNSQSAVCIKLRERGGDGKEGSEPFSYVVMEIKKAAPGAAIPRSNDDEKGDDDGGGDSQSGYRVTCGGQMDALDLCFCEGSGQSALGFSIAGGDANATPWRLAVLSITGKSISFQTQIGQVDSTSGVLLGQQVRRVFATPIPLTAASPHAQAVAIRLLYLLETAELDPDVLMLSEDDLSVPAASGGRLSGGYWASQATERVTDVQWNHSGNSGSAPVSAMLAAVWTTRRLVILSGPSLAEIRAYDLGFELQEPQSALWMGQTLLVATRDHQVRYLAPMVLTNEEKSVDSSSRLLCSLRTPGTSTSLTVQLLAACGDRLCYAVNDSATLECRSFTRPVPLCEPLLLGYSASSNPQALALLRAIFEREMLGFLQSGGGDGPPCPVSNVLLEAAYYRFGWKKAVVQVLSALLGRNGDSLTANSGPSSSAGAIAGSSSSADGFSRVSHLSRPLLASLLMDSHKWHDALRVFLADDPALEEYAFADTDDESGAVTSAKLPSRTSEIARQYRQLARVMDALGQSGLAARCLDLAGDDLALLELLRHLGSAGKRDARAMTAALGKDLARLNAPLASVMDATVSATTQQQEEQDAVERAAKLASPVWRRHDLFTLLCCETLAQTERRSRLLPTVRPFDKVTVSMVPPLADDLDEQQRQAVPPAKTLSWRRLAPEDALDWIGGASTATKVSTEDPKPLNYALFASATARATVGGGASGDAAAGSTLTGGPALAVADDSTSSSSGKMTIGPFLEEEDAVVAYWRFEEGATKAGAADNSAAGPAAASVESVDTSKRENHLTLRGFGSAIKLVPSTAPVDRGEEGKLQEEFALQFPSADADVDASMPAGDWGASCAVRTGGTLDVGFVFDEDPYRRKLTVEAWVRDYALAREQQRLRDQGEGDDGDRDGCSSAAASCRSTPRARRSLASRRSPDGATVWWELAEGPDGRLELAFGYASVLRAEAPVENAGAWHHVAFTADVSSPSVVTLRLFLNAACVASLEAATVDGHAAYYQLTRADGSDTPASMLMLGDPTLRDIEVTEVRVWASARSSEQLGDMKENYLAMAEAKRRMKITIHQRNCGCAKCSARRAAASAGAAAIGGGKKLPIASPFMSAPPSTSRDRRRPGNK